MTFFVERAVNRFRIRQITLAEKHDIADGWLWRSLFARRPAYWAS
jgi:hypothetical protein